MWTKEANRSVTGISWDYPEFAGYHGDVGWVTLVMGERELTVVNDRPGLLLQLFRPPEWPNPRQARADFPPTDLGFFLRIPPIGSKFHRGAELRRPPVEAAPGEPWEGSLYFYFGALSPDRPRSDAPPLPESE